MNKTAKIFQNGRSQAVRLPAEFRFSTHEVSLNGKAIQLFSGLNQGIGMIFSRSLQRCQRIFFLTEMMSLLKHGSCFDALYARYQYL